MTDAILTVNAGSSSLKAALYGADGETLLATALADRIGAAATLRLRGADGGELPASADGLADHAGALGAILAGFRTSFPAAHVAAVGHRVVHGGPDHAGPAVINAGVLAGIERLVPLAPLHQPHNLAGIRAASAAFPKARQVACFDTAFHRGQPFVNDTYALPRAYYDRGIRRYGFHGLSYDYIAGELARREPRLAEGSVIVAHLGNGASMCAIRDGRPIASTMGFTALDGLPMGTRSGQIDPGVLLYLIEAEGLDAAALTDLLYRKSGLLGLSGLSNDMRTLEASGSAAAEEAIGYFTARLRREIGSLAAALGGLDALIFTAGIGENSARIRAEAGAGMEWLGVRIDAARNARHAPEIGAADAPVRVLIIPTNEEVVIARAARAALDG